MLCLNVYKYTICVSCAHGGQKRVLGPMELEFYTVVNSHIDAENLRSFERAASTLYC